jgi:Leucine-rich repeat (LRR) protein
MNPPQDDGDYETGFTEQGQPYEEGVGAVNPHEYGQDANFFPSAEGHHGQEYTDNVNVKPVEYGAPKDGFAMDAETATPYSGDSDLLNMNDQQPQPQQQYMHGQQEQEPYVSDPREQQCGEGGHPEQFIDVQEQQHQQQPYNENNGQEGHFVEDQQGTYDADQHGEYLDGQQGHYQVDYTTGQPVYVDYNDGERVADHDGQPVEYHDGQPVYVDYNDGEEQPQEVDEEKHADGNFQNHYAVGGDQYGVGEDYEVDDDEDEIWEEEPDEEDRRKVAGPAGLFRDDLEGSEYDSDDDLKPKPKGRRRRRKCGWLLCCCLLLLLLLLLVWGIMQIVIDDDETKKPIEEDDDVEPDDDFEVSNPYEGIRTTPFDPFEEADCYFGDNNFPHVSQQCNCFKAINIIPNDTLALYEDIRDDINAEFYNGTFNEAAKSCDPRNQALIWLSSGNTRDSGDLYQRFIMAMTYFQMNGTNWDIQNQWLSEESECIWFSLQCNGRFQVNSFSIDAMNLHGSVPTELARLNGIRVLAFSRNHLSGTIPTELFGMSNLETLLLYDNQLNGNIPTEIGTAKKLKSFRIGGNLHHGVIPSEVGNATALEEFGLGFNDFWRKIPTEIGLLTNLKWLVLEDNRLSGTLPTEFARLTALEYFLVSKNLLIGNFPVEYSTMTNLKGLRAATTGIGGIIGTRLGLLTNLNRLELGDNNFHGSIPTEIGLMTGLSILSLNGNDITGMIPTELGQLVNMTRMTLKDCMLEGEIPTEFGQLTQLESLSLDKNSLVGRSPREVCDLRLRELNLYVTDCPSRGGVGVVCPIPDCCSFCRRGDG